MRHLYTAAQLSAIHFESISDTMTEEEPNILSVLCEAIRNTRRYEYKQDELDSVSRAMQKTIKAMLAGDRCKSMGDMASTAAAIARLCVEVKLLRDFAGNAQKNYRDIDPLAEAKRRHCIRLNRNSTNTQGA